MFLHVRYSTFSLNIPFKNFYWFHCQMHFHLVVTSCRFNIFLTLSGWLKIINNFVTKQISLREFYTLVKLLYVNPLLWAERTHVLYKLPYKAWHVYLKLCQQLLVITSCSYSVFKVIFYKRFKFLKPSTHLATKSRNTCLRTGLRAVPRHFSRVPGMSRYQSPKSHVPHRNGEHDTMSVSYTHLDVYKRQLLHNNI